MTDVIVIHSMLSGKNGPEESKRRILDAVASAFGPDAARNKNIVAFAETIEDVKTIITRAIQNGIPKIALSGGDGFTALFANVFFQMKSALKRDDYDPDVLFLAGGTGNAISFCCNFKNQVAALKCLIENKYKTERLNMLEVITNKTRELTHFVSFGADGEIISIYNSQKLKGLLGYIAAILKYSFSRKLYNPFSRNDANYMLDIKQDGRHVHSGRYEGGGVSAIPFVGYGFRPYPLAVNGIAHMRFVLFGALLMPTVFRFTRWNFLKRPNRLIYDNELSNPAVLDFSFDRDLHVQVSGDLREKQSGIRVEYTQSRAFNLVKKLD